MPQQIREGQRVRMCCECKHMSPYGGLLACFRQSGLKGSAPPRWLSLFFFLNDPPPPEISPLSLHDALPIWRRPPSLARTVLLSLLSTLSEHMGADPEDFRILFVADVIGQPGRDCVRALLPPLKVELQPHLTDRKSTRLNSSHSQISYAVFCL